MDEYCEVKLPAGLEVASPGQAASGKGTSLRPGKESALKGASFCLKALFDDSHMSSDDSSKSLVLGETDSN